MKDLISYLESNQKIDVVKKTTIPSLDDEIQYSKIEAVIKTDRSLFQWAKDIDIKPSDTEGKFNINFLCSGDPTKSLLSEIYNRCKTKEYERAKYGHDKPQLNLLVGKEDLTKIINWYYSKIN